jgi:hypothetical protein
VADPGEGVAMKRDQFFHNSAIVAEIVWPDTPDGDVVTYELGVETARRPITAEEWAELNPPPPPRDALLAALDADPLLVDDLRDIIRQAIEQGAV